MTKRTLPLCDWSAPIPSATPPSFAAERGFSPVVWPLLATRFPDAAQDADAFGRFLSPRLAHISNPMAFPGIREASAVITDAIASGREIVVFGDFDADGVTATAILVSTIRSIGGRVRPFIPLRQEGYGLSDAAVARCLADGVPSVLVTVDCGITAADALERFLALGVRVIVTDHHLPGDAVLPPQCIVAAPHLPGVPEKCRHICGAGVAFTLAAGIVATCHPDKDADGIAARRRLFSWLGALAIATVADVVPLVGENRTYVSLGLASLNSRPSTGVGQLILATMDTITVDSRHLGFVLGPHINSAGRMASATLALDLLLAEDPDSARPLAVNLKQTNAMRKAECAKVDAAVAEQIASPAIFDPAKDGAFVGYAGDWHPGVVGLAAAHACDRLNRPVALVSFSGGDPGRGSVRAPAGYDVHAALSDCAATLVSFGGHESAAGLVVERKNIDAFRRAFADACFRQTGSVSLSPSLDIAADLRLSQIDRQLLDSVDSLAPFGEGNEDPVFAIRDVCASATPFGRETAKGLRLQITDGSGANIEGLWFGATEFLPEFRDGRKWDLAATLLPSDYMGVSSVKLKIVDARPAAR